MLSQFDSNVHVTIRPFERRPEYDEAERLQAEVWGPEDVVPAHHLIATAHNGGLVLGAFAGAELVGLSYAFVGRAETPLAPPRFARDPVRQRDEGRDAVRGGRDPVRWHLYSHMLAVKKTHRFLGLGFRLKQEQRRWALANGFRLITWTFDPLEAANARLNIGKLGGIVRRYVPDYYGELHDGLNAGLPTDRFILEWWIDQRWIDQPDRQGPDGQGRPGGPEPDAAAEVWISADFQTLKRTDPEAAARERQRTREEFLRFFAAGMAVIGFAARGDKAVYLLEKALDWPPDAPNGWGER